MIRSARGRIAAVLISGCLTALLAGCSAPHAEIPAGLSDTEAMELGLSRYSYDVRLLQEEYPDVTVPEMQLSQMVDRADEWSTLQVGCLTDLGIAGAMEIENGYAVVGENDPQAEAAARFACRYRYLIDPRVLGALSAEQAGYAWDYLVERVVPCMRSIGFEPSPPADRDDFVAYSQRVWGSVLWSPYGRFEDPFTGPERTIVDRHCPPLPDDPFAVFNGTLTARLLGED